MFTQQNDRMADALLNGPEKRRGGWEWLDGFGEEGWDTHETYVNL